MKIKVSEASGPVLDWLVAKSQGFDVWHNAMLNGHIMHGFWVSGYYPGDLNSWLPIGRYTPSTDWAQGGLIIERMMRDGLRLMGYTCLPTDPTHCQAQLKNVVTGGPTPLIAALRCYVMSKLGEEVEVPAELLP